MMGTAFCDVPTNAFKNNKSFGKPKPRSGKGPPCHLCRTMKHTCIFKAKYLKSWS